MLFLNKISNKTIAYKKNILFKKFKLRLNGCKYAYIMLIKVALNLYLVSETVVELTVK
jgi:hypothetical protein